jgi:hypothetical protein
MDARATLRNFESSATTARVGNASSAFRFMEPQ